MTKTTEQELLISLFLESVLLVRLSCSNGSLCSSLVVIVCDTDTVDCREWVRVVAVHVVANRVEIPAT